EDLMTIIEGLIKRIFKECKNIDLPTPFRRLSHAVCMEKYGSDRPDLRFGLELITLNDIAAKSTFSVFLDQLKEGGLVKGLTVKKGADISRKGIDEYTEFVGRLGIKGLAWMKMQDGKLSSSIVKFFSDDLQKELITKMQVEEGDLIF